MNVGPKGDGSWDERDAGLTRRVGDWLKINGSSIYGAGASGLPIQNWGVTTRRGDTRLEFDYKAHPESKGVASVLAGHLHLDRGTTLCKLTGKGHTGQQYLCPIAIRLVKDSSR